MIFHINKNNVCSFASNFGLAGVIFIFPTNILQPSRIHRRASMWIINLGQISEIS